MGISLSDIDEISRLAGLGFSDKQKIKLKDELSSVFDFFYIPEVPDAELIEGDPPLLSENSLRVDKIENFAYIDAIFSNTELADNAFFSVPKML